MLQTQIMHNYCTVTYPCQIHATRGCFVGGLWAVQTSSYLHANLFVGKIKFCGLQNISKYNKNFTESYSAIDYIKHQLKVSKFNISHKLSH